MGDKSGHDHSHDHSHDHESDHENNSKIEDFLSISFQTKEPFSLRKFQYFLDNQLKSNVFRAKGILWFSESERRHVFHLAGIEFLLRIVNGRKKEIINLSLLEKN